ncbi:hypothetical protein APHAL10511_006218 [Amanita phalloides]|nr:hypothetical protein APHAL10511_006218 [Amanita phalloides]
MQVSPTLHEGWILKKRRKKMQGFARRYFILTNDGTLKYSFGPGKPIRDQLSLAQAAISTSHGRKDIHIDSSITTFHLKCLTTDDFETWITHFRKYILSANETRRSASVKRTSQQGFPSVSKLGGILDEMDLVIAELEKSIIAISQDNALKMHGKKSDKSKDHTRKETVLGLFRKEQFATTDPAPASLSLPSIQHAMTILNNLKVQHISLTTSLQPFVRLEATYGLRSSPLPTTAEEESVDTPLHSRHNSFATTSDSTIEWYDAPDGPEEYVMCMDEQGHVEHILSSDSRSTYQSEGDSGVDTDIEDDTQEGYGGSGSVHVIRRSELPAAIASDEGSLFTILKNNVGKDLSTIAFPVSFNEPLTLLQRAAEELEYHELLDKATQSDDPVMRICYVAAFAVSGYAHTRHRSGRKGFNPMLGETFEDSRMNFIAEKVRHQPLEIVYHAEGKGWELTATSCGKTKFWGKSLEVIPTGTTRLKIGKNDYTWNKPSSFVRNLIVGTKYLEHCGKMTIEDNSNEMRAVLEFKQNGYWGSANAVSGVVIASNGQIACQLDGKWDEYLSQSLSSSQYNVLWRINSFPKNTDQFYGFTGFAMTLNEITSDLIGKLPPTDSRYRPDVRALEEGDLDSAEEEKRRVEELQRERRRNGKEQTPRWYKQIGDEWVYTGRYWDARKNGWEPREHMSLW